MEYLKHLSVQQLEVAIHYNQMIGDDKTVEELYEALHIKKIERRDCCGKNVSHTEKA